MVDELLNHVYVTIWLNANTETALSESKSGGHLVDFCSKMGGDMSLYGHLRGGAQDSDSERIGRLKFGGPGPDR